MRFLFLVPGTGHFYCGSCLRDDGLARALRSLGHASEVVPLYLPLVLEGTDDTGPVRLGGINAYLQQRSRLARYLPRWLAALLDKKSLLRWASRRGDMTDPGLLGAMTLSMLEGEEGRQAREIGRLAAHVRTVEPPDVIVLSNTLLLGLAGPLREALRRPVACTLQGEAPFLDALPGDFARRCWDRLRVLASGIDLFVPVSGWYGEEMTRRLGLDPGRVRVVWNGLDVDDLRAEPPPLAARRPPVLGYLARLCAEKGLPLLVEAFLRLKVRGRVPGLRLGIAGALLAQDRPLLRKLTERIGAAGHAGDFEVLPNVDRARKLAFLRSLSVFSVPATYGESFGLYVLEALAAGVPVVAPRLAAFPEVLEATGGGILCEPGDPEALAGALEALLLDPACAQHLAKQGRRAVLETMTSAHMARAFVEACREAGLDRRTSS